MTVIKIDRYEPKISGNKIKYYAVAGKKTYEMPDAYKSMYNDQHLAITERTLEMADVLDVPATHYIPLFTGDKE